MSTSELDRALGAVDALQKVQRVCERTIYPNATEPEVQHSNAILLGILEFCKTLEAEIIHVATLYPQDDPRRI